MIGELGGGCVFGVPCLIAVVTGHAALKEGRTLPVIHRGVRRSPSRMVAVPRRAPRSLTRSAI
jgi:hypothetical protein